MVPKSYLDGTMAYGSRAITIDGVSYILNNVQISRPVNEAKDYGTLGQPGRRRATADVAELSAELQLAASTTTYPQFGDTWQMTVDDNYGAETWVLDPVPYEEDNQPTSIRVVNITAKKVINSITTVA